MEKVCAEDIIKGLLALEYDRIDSIFLTMVIGKLSLDQKIEYEEREFTDFFLKYVEYDGITHHLKKGYKLDTNISPDKDDPWTIRQAFSKKKELLKALEEIDLQRIVDKKVMIIGYENLKDYLDVFSNKEKKLLPRIKPAKQNIDYYKRNK